MIGICFASLKVNLFLDMICFSLKFRLKNYTYPASLFRVVGGMVLQVAIVLQFVNDFVVGGV